MPRPSLKHDYKGCRQPLYHELRWAYGYSRKKLERSQESSLVCGMYFYGTKPRGADQKSWKRVKVILCDRCIKRLGIEW